MRTQVRLTLRTKVGIRKLIDDYVKSFNFYLNNVKRLRTVNYIELKYEDFCENPISTSRKLADFLVLDPLLFDTGFIKAKEPRFDQLINDCYVEKNVDFESYL